MTQSPAKLYALIAGIVLLIAGIAGFFYSSSFGSPGEVDALIGIFDVNAWHNIVHIATGLLGLIAWRYGAREYALGLGFVYLVVAIWGFILGDGESILGFLPISTEDNVLHLALGVAGLTAGFLTHAATERPARGGPAPAH
jgi:hypothetical protein